MVVYGACHVAYALVSLHWWTVSHDNSCRCIVAPTSTLQRCSPPSCRPTGGPSVLDAGANIGAASLLFAHMIAMRGHILSVEAFPANFEVLARNMAPLAGVVTPVPKAIVAHDLALAGHKLNFTGSSNQYWGFRVDHHGVAAQAHEGNVVTQVDTISLPMLQVCAELLALASGNGPPVAYVRTHFWLQVQCLTRLPPLPPCWQAYL